MLLETKKLTKRFGGLTVMKDLDVTLKQGEILALIGPNGAGKSTFFNLVTGCLEPTSGLIFFEDKEITGCKPHEAAALGIGRTFQLNPLFGDFTVFENVTAAHHLHPHSSLLDIYFNTRKYKSNEKLIADNSEEILQTLGLYHVRNELAKNLPHGYQKILGVARALATKPKVLLLDEPLGGMNPEEIHFTIDAINTMNKEKNITVLIVEHNMQILDICDRVTVISFGQKICEGLPCDVKNNEDVIKTYFGGVSYE
ncbi:MAG: ABC transporter ATP-binding protein [Clostridiales bacterium]|nr:ABC transporter ATP-binding protein [Clostridiales bacterium]